MKSTNFLFFRLIVLFILLSLQSCQSKSQQKSTFHPIDYEQFGGYWYQGKAELANYSLTQARYGEIHEGTAVLIFVTEDFSKSKQVKLDRPEKAEKDKVSVMKLNFTKKFNTGIYPYSMMTSVFRPVHLEDYPYALKATTSVQEWCGQTFLQYKRAEKGYEAEAFSYFESEGDQKLTIKGAILEDDLWTLIRIAPDQLPTGQFPVIPSGMISRLRHQSLKSQQVKATLKAVQYAPVAGKELMQYHLEFESERTLDIYFDKAFPYVIRGWEEVYISGFGEDQKKLTTRGALKKVIQLDYWRKNSVKDSVYRKELGLHP